MKRTTRIERRHGIPLRVPRTDEEYAEVCTLVKVAVTCRPIRQIRALPPSEGIDSSEALVGEVIMKIRANDWRALRMYRGGNPVSYLRAIAINFCRDRLRAKSNHIDQRSDSWNQLVEDGVQVRTVPSYAMADSDASELLQRKEDSIELRRMIAGVSNPVHRCILVMSLLEDCSAEEVGRRMRVSTNTVYLVTSRFRKAHAASGERRRR